MKRVERRTESASVERNFWLLTIHEVLLGLEPQANLIFQACVLARRLLYIVYVALMSG